VTRYVALLRGIAPTNPNMANANLRAVCERLGLRAVQTVISSGNVIFESDTSDAAGLEESIEAAWRSELGFTSTTILRSETELEGLVESDPFAGRTHGPETYLLVTFAKHPFTVEYAFPYQPPERDYWIVGATSGELFSVTDTAASQTPDVMSWIESRLGKEISSRTWLTVNRILERMRKT
jgi:uncharacterized protein (DUF1697 family)